METIEQLEERHNKLKAELDKVREQLIKEYSKRRDEASQKLEEMGEGKPRRGRKPGSKNKQSEVKSSKKAASK